MRTSREILRGVRATVGRGRRGAAPPPSGPLATETDVRAAYRLLLGREPDPEGFGYWCGLAARGLPLESLTRAFIGSPEYAAREGMASEPQPIQADGFVVYARAGDALYGPHFAAFGEYEPHVAAVLRARLEPGSRFLDVGANIGYFTLLAASIVGATGRVVAIEALQDNAALCARSVAANGFTQVALHHVAASDGPGQLAVHGSPADSNARVDASDGAVGETVEAVVLDDFLGDLDALHLVKLDVEGYEPRALAGMRGLLERFKPPLVVEFNPDTLALAGHDDPLVLPRSLAELGYAPRVIEHDGSGLTDVRPDALGDLVVTRRVTHLDILFASGASR